jgi:hypothetical protein
VDINDLWANAVGVWLGYALFRISAWFFLFLIRNLNITPTGFALYLFDRAQ